MLSKEVKIILEEKYDQDKNYKKILHNVEKHNNTKKSYFETIRYTLVPLCIALVLGIISISTLNNNNNTLNNELIAKTNNLDEKNPTNVTIEKEIYKKYNAVKQSGQ